MADDLQPTADGQTVQEWATAYNISPGSIKTLFKDGPSGLDFIQLLEKDDLSHKIPHGQQRLILHAA